MKAMLKDTQKTITKMKLNKEPKAMNNFCWYQIEAMNFNERGYKGAGEYLVNEAALTFKGMKEVRNFATKKANALYDKLFPITGVSDDSFSDLIWQIVANGKEFYNNITLEQAQKMADNYEYTESFAYAFHIVDEMEDEQNNANAYLKAERYLEDIRRGYGGGFVTKLVAAFDHADAGNKRKLAKGFPEIFGPLVD